MLSVISRRRVVTTRRSINVSQKRSVAIKSAADIPLATVARNAKIPVALNTLKNIPGSRKKPIIVGRGRAGRRGKTCGKGHNGERARQGGSVNLGFEGGQTPLYKKLRKFGFKNYMFKREYAPVNLDRLQYWIDTGRIDPTQKITMKTLIDSGCVGKLRRRQVGIKLLGEGADWFNVPNINIEVSQASTKAIEAIQRCNGTIRLVYYNRTGLRSLLKPEKYEGAEGVSEEEQQNLRLYPYLPPPPRKINAKLKHKMEQPDQHPLWIARQERLKAEAAAAATAAAATQ